MFNIDYYQSINKTGLRCYFSKTRVLKAINLIYLKQKRNRKRLFSIIAFNPITFNLKMWITTTVSYIYNISESRFKIIVVYIILAV